MPTDYERVYQESKDALGPPTKEYLAFFESYDKPHSWVLDVGCGQGRDALFVARLGHQVTAIDLSETGVRQMLEDANEEALNIDGITADIRTFQPKRKYDVIIIDRTLHMLKESERLDALRSLIRHVTMNGFVLIADERKNIPAIEEVFEASENRWTVTFAKRGLIFLQLAQ